MNVRVQVQDESGNWITKLEGAVLESEVVQSDEMECIVEDQKSSLQYVVQFPLGGS